MFGCYLDASGITDDQPYLVMAGFFAPVDNWITFESDWADLLNASAFRDRLWIKNGIRYSHAKKMQRWPVALRQRFYAEANYLLARAKATALVCWVKHADYKAVHSLEPKQRTKDSIYGLSFRGAMVAVCDDMTDNYQSAPIAFVLEEGDPNQGGARRIFDSTLNEGNQLAEIRKQYPVETIAIAPKERYGALQAADMHAYVMLKHLLSARGRRRPNEWFGDINILLSNLLHSTLEIDKSMLLTLSQ